MPLNRVTAVPEKGTEIQGLLDLLEKQLNVPTGFIQVADARRCPLEIVGQKFHHNGLSVDFELRGDFTHGVRILFALRFAFNKYAVIPQNGPILFLKLPFGAAQFHGAFDPANPENAPLGQFTKVLVVNIGHIKNRNFTGLNAGAYLTGLGIIMSSG